MEIKHQHKRGVNQLAFDYQILIIKIFSTAFNANLNSLKKVTMLANTNIIWSQCDKLHMINAHANPLKTEFTTLFISGLSIHKIYLGYIFYFLKSKFLITGFTVTLILPGHL